jgi:hypothetical protein
MHTEFQKGTGMIINGERDRRIKRRFPIQQDVRYKMLYGHRIAETGSGKTVNISSGGVCFTTETLLASGTPIELSLAWPVLLNDLCPMKLTIYGCVVRSNGGGAAVAIERSEFRTTGRSMQTLPVSAPVQPVKLQSASGISLR